MELLELFESLNDILPENSEKRLQSYKPVITLAMIPLHGIHLALDLFELLLESLELPFYGRPFPSFPPCESSGRDGP